jgi:hypothetical protein
MANNKKVEPIAEDATEQENGEVSTESQQAAELVETVRVAFTEAVADGQAEDDVKLVMIGAGATFKNVARHYNAFMIDAGFAISKSDRDQIVSDTLEGRDFETEEDFGSAVAALTPAVQGATERSAAALVRSYAKKANLPCYVKPKGEGGTRTSFASLFYDFLVANPTMSKEDATAYIMAEGNSENVKKNLPHYIGIWSLINRVVEADAAKAA